MANCGYEEDVHCLRKFSEREAGVDERHESSD
jgi:hypothetical protein